MTTAKRTTLFAHFAQPRLDVSLQEATSVTDLIGSSGRLCSKPAVHSGRKA